MIKSFILILSLVFSFNSFAALDSAQVNEKIKGQYRISVEENNFSFVIRSNHEVMMLDESDSVQKGELFFVHNENDGGPDGLPVAHLVFINSSDEESQEIHILMTVVQEDEQTTNLRLINAFTTFNDGPNGTSEFSPATISLQKYNKQTKKFEAVK